MHITRPSPFFDLAQLQQPRPVTNNAMPFGICRLFRIILAGDSRCLPNARLTLSSWKLFIACVSILRRMSGAELLPADGDIRIRSRGCYRPWRRICTDANAR